MNFETSSSTFEEEPQYHPQNYQWSISTPLKSTTTRPFLQSPLHDQFHSHFSNSQSRSKQNTLSTNIESQAVFTSFDIYGNELSMKEETSFEAEESPVGVDLTWDGGFKDQTKSDKENSKPLLSIITPLKKRDENRNNSAKSSFGTSRSPLCDITPSLSVKKAIMPQEFKIEKVLIYGGTPNREGMEKGASGLKSMR